MKKTREIIIGVLAVILILIGGSLYNGLLGSAWYKLINFIF